MHEHKIGDIIRVNGIKFKIVEDFGIPRFVIFDLNDLPDKGVGFQECDELPPPEEMLSGKELEEYLKQEKESKERLEELKN